MQTKRSKNMAKKYTKPYMLFFKSAKKIITELIGTIVDVVKNVSGALAKQARELSPSTVEKIEKFFSFETSKKI